MNGPLDEVHRCWRCAVPINAGPNDEPICNACFPLAVAEFQAARRKRAARVATTVAGLTELFDALDRGELFIEDLSPDLVARLRAVIDRQVR